MTFTLRDLIAPLTVPARLWLRKVWLMSRISMWEADIELMDRIDLNHREARKLRHYQIGEANSELQRLYR